MKLRLGCKYYLFDFLVFQQTGIRFIPWCNIEFFHNLIPQSTVENWLCCKPTRWLYDPFYGLLCFFSTAMQFLYSFIFFFGKMNAQLGLRIKCEKYLLHVSPGHNSLRTPYFMVQLALTILKNLRARIGEWTRKSIRFLSG